MITSLDSNQSGQSKIEHSYKADSDLSPLGWDYAEHLKDFVIRKRKEVVDERKRIGDATEEKKLNVSPLLFSFLDYPCKRPGWLGL